MKRMEGKRGRKDKLKRMKLMLLYAKSLLHSKREMALGIGDLSNYFQLVKPQVLEKTLQPSLY